MEYTEQLANNHISVDCVVIGFDGEKLKVLLVKRMGEESGEVFHDMKLPGSLIYMDEDLDDAAKRVLRDLTGLKNVDLMQFKGPYQESQRCSLAGKSRKSQSGTNRDHRLLCHGKNRQDTQQELG